MKFIRENLFLVILGAAVLVVVALLLVVNSSLAGNVDKGMAIRQKLWSQLDRIKRTPVNQEIVDAEKDRVQAIRADYENVRRMNVDWNRRNYSVMEYDPASNGQLVQAFPMPADRLRQYGSYNLTREYRKQLKQLLKTLTPTTIPTDPELKSKAAFWRIQIEQEQLRERMKEERDSTTPTTAQPRSATAGRAAPIPMPGLSMGASGGRSGASMARSTARSTGNVSQLAMDRAIASLMLEKSQAGLIYASLDSMDEFFTSPDNMVGVHDLWLSQINLWVTRDIVAAINETNQQVLRGSGTEPNKPVVGNAAVKRLVEINIDEKYFPWGAGVSSTRFRSTAGGSATRYRSGPSAMPMGMTPTPGMAPGMYTRTTRKTPPSRSKTGAPSAEGDADNLTRRTTCKEYEVVHYSFTVVIPTSHLILLEKNLSRQNLHTILRVEIEGVDEDLGQLYYYGTEPVTKATIYGELLLLTAWERGTYDPKAREWSKKYPPLLPEPNLKSLDVKSSSEALRQEDKERVESFVERN